MGLTILGSSGGSTSPAAWSPSYQGFTAASFDPALANTASALGNGGTPSTARIFLPNAVTLTNMLVYVKTAGTSLTSGQCFGAIYKTDGTLIASTADQSGSWNSTGLKTMALTVAGGQSLTQGGSGQSILAAVWVNGGGTQVQMSCFGSNDANVTNALTSGRSMRAGFYSTGGVTTVPSTMWTPNQTSSVLFWVGFS